MARSKHISRTKEALKERGFWVWEVERFIAFPKPGRRVDLFHIIDLLAIKGDLTLGVQVCGSDFGAHDRKILEEQREYTDAWLACPHRGLELWAWRKKKNKLKGGGYGTGYHWEPRIKLYGQEDTNG